MERHFYLFGSRELIETYEDYHLDKPEVFQQGFSLGVVGDNDAPDALLDLVKQYGDYKKIDGDRFLEIKDRFLTE